MKQVEDKERLLVEMQCKWCGKETPDESAFCEWCGKALADKSSDELLEKPADTSDDAPLNDADEGPAYADEAESSNAVDEEPENALDEERHAAGEKLSADEKLPDAVEVVVAEENVTEEAATEETDAFEPWLFFGTSADASSEAGTGEPAASIPNAFRRSKRDEPLVDPPTPPDQPKLGMGRTVIVATVAVLFAAALILLTCVILMRVLGL